MMPESAAAAILWVAIYTGRAAELLACLFDGGWCTVDQATGELVLVTAEQMGWTKGRT